MKPLALLLAAALTAPLLTAPLVLAETAAFAGQAEILESVHLVGVIEVDASGRVEQVSLRRNLLLPKVQRQVLEVMQGWTFEPHLVEGTPRRIRTSVHVRVDHLKSDAGYQLVLGEVEFGQPLAQQLTPPRYPASSLRNRIAAEVLLRLTLDDSGGVALAEPVSAYVLNREMRNEKQHRRLIEPFTRASVEAVHGWRFDFVGPRADGEPHQMLVPMSFTIDGMYAGQGGRRPQNPPVLFELSTPLGRPLDALAREVKGRSGGLSISPAASPLKLRSRPDDTLAM